jgi:hypothetical protein
MAVFEGVELGRLIDIHVINRVIRKVVHGRLIHITRIGRRSVRVVFPSLGIIFSCVIQKRKVFQYPFSFYWSKDFLCDKVGAW